MNAPAINEVYLDYAPGKDGQIGPNEKQKIAHAACDLCEEVLYGGAAGGGKTAWIIAEVLSVLMKFPGATGVIFRRTYDQLIELGGIAQELAERIPRSLGTYNEQKRIWRFSNGSVLRLNYVARDADVTKLQGGQFAIVAFDQVEQFTEYQYTYVIHRLRVSGTVAASMEAMGYTPKVISSANPAGVGQAWVKARFIDPFPKGNVVFQPKPTDEEPNPGKRCFVPAGIYDNLHNLHPSYLEKLQQLPEDLRKAMLYGDWNVFAGQKFREFRTDIHVVDPSRFPMQTLIPQRRAMGVDYGMDAPFCALWGAKLPDNLIVVYRELYKPGLTPTEQAKLILASETPGERNALRRVPVFLDPSCWTRSPYDLTEPDPNTGAPPAGSVAGGYWAEKIPAQRAYNHRIPGVARVHEKLRLRPGPSGPEPKLLIFSTCRNLIRTIPALVRDDKNPEDIDTDGEDHAYDALRYLLFGLEPMNTDRAITTQPKRRLPVADDERVRPSVLAPSAVGARSRKF